MYLDLLHATRRAEQRCRTVAVTLWVAALAASSHAATSYPHTAPSALAPAGGVIFFSNCTESEGCELWKSDGTPTGTVIVKDLYPGMPSSDPEAGLYAEGLYFFSASTPSGGRELWRSDGTAAGTSMIEDVYPGANGSSPRDLTAMNGAVFFTADDGANGRQLWRTSGTSAGTERVTSLPPVARGLRTVGGTLYFTSGVDLYRTDGTGPGTVWLDVQNASLPTVVNGSLFFVRDKSLWVIPSLGSTPTLLRTAGRAINQLTSVNGILFFRDEGQSGQDFTEDVWRSDGTSAGTFRIESITCYGFQNCAYPGTFVDVDGLLFYTVGLSEFPYVYLMKTNGVPNTATHIATFGYRWAVLNGNEVVYGVANANGTLYLSVADKRAPNTDFELWKTDGTAAGTVVVKDIEPGATASSFPQDLTPLGSMLFFTAQTSTTGRVLWRTDGTPDGTIQLTEHASTSISIDDVSLAEGNVGTTLFGLTVSLTWPSAEAVTVDFATEDDTAVAGTHYGGRSGTLTFAPGETTRVILVSVNTNTVAGPQKTFRVRLSHPSPGIVLGDDLGLATIVNDDPAGAAALVTVYRLYHDGTHEHLFTNDAREYAALPAFGWTQEGAAFQMWKTGGVYDGQSLVPLYRLYHSWTRQHHWTTDVVETRVLGEGAWKYEGIAGYVLPSAATGAVPLYRLALPDPPLHLWTIDPRENAALPAQGWQAEGIVGYVLP